jgi:hypothetical protein
MCQTDCDVEAIYSLAGFQACDPPGVVDLTVRLLGPGAIVFSSQRTTIHTLQGAKGWTIQLPEAIGPDDLVLALAMVLADWFVALVGRNDSLEEREALAHGLLLPEAALAPLRRLDSATIAERLHIPEHVVSSRVRPRMRSVVSAERPSTRLRLVS